MIFNTSCPVIMGFVQALVARHESDYVFSTTGEEAAAILDTTHDRSAAATELRYLYCMQGALASLNTLLESSRPLEGFKCYVPKLTNTKERDQAVASLQAILTSLELVSFEMELQNFPSSESTYARTVVSKITTVAPKVLFAIDDAHRFNAMGNAFLNTCYACNLYDLTAQLTDLVNISGTNWISRFDV